MFTNAPESVEELLEIGHRLATPSGFEFMTEDPDFCWYYPLHSKDEGAQQNSGTGAQRDLDAVTAVIEDIKDQLPGGIEVVKLVGSMAVGLGDRFEHGVKKTKSENFWTYSRTTPKPSDIDLDIFHDEEMTDPKGVMLDVLDSQATLSGDAMDRVSLYCVPTKAIFEVMKESYNDVLADTLILSSANETLVDRSEREDHLVEEAWRIVRGSGEALKACYNNAASRFISAQMGLLVKRGVLESATVDITQLPGKGLALTSATRLKPQNGVDYRPAKVSVDANGVEY